MRRTQNAELAADLTAETFAQALQSKKRFRRGNGVARAWLFGIASHVLARSARRQQVEQRARQKLGLERLELDDDAIARIEQLADADVVALALDGLDESRRVAVHARIIEEQPYELIAERLSCSEAVVRQRVSRGLRQLRTSLEGTV